MFTCNNADYEERGRECSHVTMFIMKREEGRENFHIQWMLIWAEFSCSHGNDNEGRGREGDIFISSQELEGRQTVHVCFPLWILFCNFQDNFLQSCKTKPQTERLGLRLQKVNT